MNKTFIMIIKIIAAIILLQTLFFKFSGAQESVELFTVLAGKNEAFMRIGIGVLELIASVLLFIPKTTWFGALLSVGLMGGAIMSHLTKLGIEFNNDHGLLFASALIVFIFGLIILFDERKSIPVLGKKL